MHAVRGGEIEQRVVARAPRRDVVHVSRRAICQKHRAGLRAEGEHVAGAVVFFVASRPLVFLDDVAVVFVHRKARRQPELLVIAHPQSIEIQRGFVFEHERGVFQAREIVDGAIVDGGRVGVSVGGQFQLGSRDAQEAERVVVS